jgi:peptide/nickel transport system permease protein
MAKYTFKRILITIPVLIGVVLLIFVMLSVVPGDPVTVMMGDKVKPDVIAHLTESMHLNDPWYLRFLWYIRDAAHGDFGTSYKLNRTVSSVIGNAFPKTLLLAVCAAVLSWIIGIPTGIISAVKKNTAVDRIFMGFALCGISLPAFSVGMLLQNLFNGILPVSGFSSPMNLILPSIVLGWGSSGTIARLTRSSLLEVMEDDYIRTARAKGLSPSKVILRHALKNSLLPVITMMAIQVSGLLSGAVITETLFSIPGIGRLAVDAINSRDMPLLQGTVIFTTVIIIVGNLIADLLYSVVDPRIRVEGGN